MTLDEMKERLAAIDAELSDIIAQLGEEPVEDEERATTEELETRSANLMEERETILADIEKAEAAIAEEKRAMEEVKTKCLSCVLTDGRALKASIAGRTVLTTPQTLVCTVLRILASVSSPVETPALANTASSGATA